MSLSLFNPFETLHFDPATCFLTGVDLKSVDEQISIFPDWVLDRFSLRDKRFKMLDQVTRIHYEDLKLPASPEVKQAFDNLEKEIKEAFDSGYDAVKNIPSERLFLWMGRFVYGVLYNDINLEIQRSSKRPGSKGFEMSTLLREKLGKFHLMLQSLVVAMEFKGLKPWTIDIVKVKYSKDTFNYKDEPTNLNFSLGMNGFGIIACLQDNGAIGKKQQDIIRKIDEKLLHPIQFEELCARFLYSNYLLKKRPQHNIQAADEKLIIESLPMDESIDYPLFGEWSDDMFAQVLAGYWEPWAFEKKAIYTSPDSPLSFLENDFTHQLIDPESVSLPY